jgi:hypothetical protein
MSNDALQPISQPNKIPSPLFHGSLALTGSHIDIRSGTGVGWNAFTLGNAFYTSESIEAATLFSHLVLQKAVLNGQLRCDNEGYAKVYSISVNERIKILDTSHPLDVHSVQGVLLHAGVPGHYFKGVRDKRLTDFNACTALLCYGKNWEGNRNEYLCKALGFDALLINEQSWMNWDYYPNISGVDWGAFCEPARFPPRTLAIYRPESIEGFKLVKDGMIYDRGEDHHIGR